MSQVTFVACGPQCLSNTILNRREARSRLHQLTPGTEEYNKLQRVLTRTVGIVEISLQYSVYKVDTSSEDYLTLGGFGPSEHATIGKSVTLPEFSIDTPLIEREGTEVRFDQIVALAGDYYGIAGQAISLPSKTPEERIERFKNAFNNLAEEANPAELQEVLKEIEQECHEVPNSSLPHHCYSSHLMEHMSRTQKIKQNFEELLLDNSDHFSEDAKAAYIAGHTYALQLAQEAGRQPTQKQKLAGLKLAYAADAFACHFLTDLFAAGHIRNQRGKLELFITKLVESSSIKPSGQNVKQLAAILTGAQHEKDGNEGLNVKNDQGECWRAYGDGSFFTPKNEENRKKAQDALQGSVQEVYAAYLAGAEQKAPSPSTVYQLIPQVTPFNPLPLYSCDGKSLFLHHGGISVEITTLMDYLNQGLSQALRYLPEDYITGMILSKVRAVLPNIPIPVPIQKIVIPLAERVTDIVWHTAGIATYYQVKQEAKRLNEKINEMADIVVATHAKSEEILRQIENIQEQIGQQKWEKLTKEVRKPLMIIEKRVHQFQNNQIEDMSKGLLKIAEVELCDANHDLYKVFKQGTAVEHRSILAAYAERLEVQNTMTRKERKITVTLWFKQILIYQHQAFNLSKTLRLIREGYREGDVKELEKFQRLESVFLSQLSEQVAANQQHIDTSLIDKSLSYISLQLKKSEDKREASSQLKLLIGVN
ncbi:MAG: hypothetical protein JSS10_01185 [Verrucomicrobia bacterium]|nr:hypothetical protein [Verrucomicrobiota bacterium]